MESTNSFVINSFWKDPAIATLAIVAVLTFIIVCIAGSCYLAKRKFPSIKIGKYHLGILWFVIIATLAIDIWQFYLYSNRQIPAELPAVFTINIAILSALIIIVTLALTASGLAKLETIEEKAKEIAKETVQDYLDNIRKIEGKETSLYKESIDSGLILKPEGLWDLATKARWLGERK